MGSALPTGSFIFTAETYLLWTGDCVFLCGKQRLLKYQEEASHVVITHLRSNSLKLSFSLTNTDVHTHYYVTTMNAVSSLERKQNIVLLKL